MGNRGTIEEPTMRATSLSQAEPARSEPARSMADYLRQAGPDSGAEALSLLRRMFPDTPLADRVAALAAAMRR